MDAVFCDSQERVTSANPRPVKQESAESSPVVKQEHADDEAEDDDDPEIVILKKQFALDLAKIRARKRGAVASAPVNPAVHGRVMVDRNKDGSLSVTSVAPKEELKVNIKTESNAIDPTAPNADTAADVQQASTESDLDPWTQAAIASLEARHVKKNDEKKKTY